LITSQHSKQESSGPAKALKAMGRFCHARAVQSPAAFRMEPIHARFAGLLGVAMLTTAAIAFVSCSALQRTVVVPPAIEGATFTGNASCAECHTNYSRAFPSSPHARVHRDGSTRGDTGCESCHGPGSKHIAAGGGRGKFIVNPGKDPQACFNCHLQTHAEFHLPQHHPVPEGRMNCIQCHDPHGRDILKPAGFGLGMARLNETCAECHREQAKPHVYEHRALWEGCTTCHNPHGSVHAKLLIQRDLNLCLKCHAQATGANPGMLIIGKIPHDQFVKQGACWSAGCHSAVHGSSVSPRLHY
jgi:predicted CXXCH cytochrome family protein